MTMLSIRNSSIEFIPIDRPRPFPGNPRTHSDEQIRQLVNSMQAFGYINPILCDADYNVIAGHGRLRAAKRLGLDKIPVICITDLTEHQIRAYRLADNKLAGNADWDNDLLRVEIEALCAAELGFEITDTGFANAEIDLVLGAATGANDCSDSKAEIAEVDLEGPPVTQRGDLFLCGDAHRLLCGDALCEEDYKMLLAGEKAACAVTDPPYNVRIDGNVSGTGRHREFAMASGEMSVEQFTGFLEQVLVRIAASLVSGGLAYVCMDWRHLGEVLASGKSAFDELLNVCVWTKANGGMGSLYRSAHELVLVFRSGRGKHVNNVQLGRYGRNRTNVWCYPGVNSFGAGRANALAMHPTVKPVALVADALLDCTRRKDMVLDPFAGSGTILIAAHRTGRRARAIELDPRYVDICLRRFRRVTGVDSVHAGSGLAFSQLEQQRRHENPDMPAQAEGQNND